MDSFGPDITYSVTQYSVFLFEGSVAPAGTTNPWGSLPIQRHWEHVRKIRNLPHLSAR